MKTLFLRNNTMYDSIKVKSILVRRRLTGISTKFTYRPSYMKILFKYYSEMPSNID